MLLSAPVVLVMLLFLPAAKLHKRGVKQLQVSGSQVYKQAEIPEAKKQQVIENYGSIPLSFEVNKGQTAEEVNFLSRGSGYNLFLTPTEAVLALSKPVAKSRVNDLLRMKMLGAIPAARFIGLDELAAKSNYFIGNDPKKWHTNISNYRKVKYEAVYPGVDMVYYGNQRQLEYDFVVAPGADHSQIKLSFEGAEKIEIDAEGNLVLSTQGGQLKQHRPIIYQEEENGRLEIAGNYVLKGKNEAGFEVGFEVGAYDTSRPLVIDPTLSYSTYLGGTGLDSSTDMIVDSAGNAYLTGQTSSTTFPTLNPFQGTYGLGPNDAFVTKLNSSGNGLIYSTFLGGSGDDIGNSIAIDPTGNVYVIGQTSSANFSTTLNAYQSSLSGTQDAFLAKLNPSGSALLFSSYLGGSVNEQGFGIDVDSSGKAYLSGTTNSTNFPFLNGFQNANGGGSQDGFVAVLNTNLSGSSSLLYSTYLGGNGNTDNGLALVLDSSGIAYVGGQTNSTNFPTTSNGLLTTFGGGGQDGFLTKINTNLSGSASLLYSSYIGGNGVDQVADIDVDSAGNTYLTGVTRSPNYPIKNAFQSIPGGLPGIQDACVTKVNTNLSGSASLVYSTFLGGKIDEQAFGIAIDSAGNAYVAGITNSTNFPTLNAIQSTFGLGPNDVFVTKLNSSGNGLIYSTYLGGSGDDFCRGIAVDSKGNAYVIGHTTSTNYPTVNAYQGSLSGTQDAFVAKITEITCPQTITITQQPANVTSCAGSPATFSVTASGTDLTYQWFKNDSPISGATGSSFTIASVIPTDEDSYYVVITNACSDVMFSVEATLTVNTPPSFITSKMDITCNGGSDGSITVTTTSGTAPFMFSKDGGITFQESNVFNNLAAGTYNIAVKDLNNCSIAEQSVTITEPPALMLNETHNNVSCFGSSNGSINLSVSGGTPGFSFAWSNGATTEDLSGLAAGNYSVTVTDANGCTAMQSVKITEPQQLTSSVNPESVLICAGSSEAFTVNPSGGTSPYTYLWSNGATTQSINVSAAGVYSVTITDANGCTSTRSATLAVNTPPIITNLTGPSGPIAKGNPAAITVNFTDTGITNDTVTISWGDNTTDNTFVGASSPLSTTHTYTDAGVYTVDVTVTDGCGASATMSFQFIVIYDPNGGFVTGGGFITSPAGAYVANPSLTGKANFGFVSKYLPGANVPSGNTEFQFKAAGLNFKSSEYEWLVVAGAKAQFKGTGTVNGTGNYGFMLTAIDGQINGGGGVDKFRIKIWDKNNGDAIVYDNQIGGSDDAEPTTAIASGSIVIHKP
jgi:hypothetical protein